MGVTDNHLVWSVARLLAHNAYGNRSKPGKPSPAGNRTETYYRTTSQADYNKLLKTGRMSATSATFISPTRSFLEGYQGVLVQFKVKAETRAVSIREPIALAGGTTFRVGLPR